MNQYQENLSSATKKMILGIVFSATALVLLFVSIDLLSAGIYDEDLLIAGVILLFIAFGLAGVGIPFLIKGIKNRIHYGNLISKENQAQLQQQLASQQPAPQQEAPVYAQPAPQYAQPAPQQPAPAYAQPAPQYAQPAPQQPAPAYAQPQAAYANGFVDIDIARYNPMEAGVSMKPGKDYKFHRADGFVGSVPQKFVDRTFVKCPLCCSDHPAWTISQHNQMSWKGNLYLFKCSACDGIISMTMPDVTTLGNGAGGIAHNPNVGLTNLLAKKSSGKDVTAVYAAFESLGRSGVNPVCLGKEIKLDDMQRLALRM